MHAHKLIERKEKLPDQIISCSQSYSHKENTIVVPKLGESAALCESFAKEKESFPSKKHNSLISLV